MTSHGLKWDLDATRLAMGGLVRVRSATRLRQRQRRAVTAHARVCVVATQVSTSNAVVAEEVVVETDAPLIWTTQLHARAPPPPPDAADAPP